MSEKYIVIYSPLRCGWCVFEQLTASIRTFYQLCGDKTAAEKLAEKLNAEARHAE